MIASPPSFYPTSPRPPCLLLLCRCWCWHTTTRFAPRLTAAIATRASCGDYKAYWYIDGESTTPLPEGIQLGVQTLETPVIFDVSTDWSENSPLSPHSAGWKAAKSTTMAARAAHLKVRRCCPHIAGAPFSCSCYRLVVLSACVDGGWVRGGMRL